MRQTAWKNSPPVAGQDGLAVLGVGGARKGGDEEVVVPGQQEGSRRGGEWGEEEGCVEGVAGHCGGVGSLMREFGVLYGVN